MPTLRIRVRSSLLHGRGVFAAQWFRRGDFIATALGRQTEIDGPYVLWVLQGDGSYRGVKVASQLRFLNHSRRPNAEFLGADLYAIKAITPDEEITFDYGDGSEGSNPCRRGGSSSTSPIY